MTPDPAGASPTLLRWLLCSSPATSPSGVVLGWARLHLRSARTGSHVLCVRRPPPRPGAGYVWLSPTPEGWAWVGVQHPPAHTLTAWPSSWPPPCGLPGPDLSTARALAWALPLIATERTHPQLTAWASPACLACGVGLSWRHVDRHGWACDVSRGCR